MRRSLAFTGTQRGMTDAQFATCDRLLALWKPTEIHHGDCIGADDQIDQLAQKHGIDTVIHPPENPSKRAWCHRRWLFNCELDAKSGIKPTRAVVELAPAHYLERNQDIVNEGNALLATPFESAEQRRSGTWFTIRRGRIARFQRDDFKRTVIVWPDGVTFTEGAK